MHKLIPTKKVQGKNKFHTPRKLPTPLLPPHMVRPFVAFVQNGKSDPINKLHYRYIQRFFTKLNLEHLNHGLSVTLLTYITLVVSVSCQWMYRDVFHFVVYVTKLVFYSIFRISVILKYL